MGDGERGAPLSDSHFLPIISHLAEVFRWTPVILSAPAGGARLAQAAAWGAFMMHCKIHRRGFEKSV